MKTIPKISRQYRLNFKVLFFIFSWGFSQISAQLTLPDEHFTDTTAANSQRSDNLFSSHTSNSAAAKSAVVWDVFLTGNNSILREMRPKSYQLYPRKADNHADVVFSGSASGASIITIFVYKTKLNGVTSLEKSQAVSLKNGHFYYTYKIHAELSEYRFTYILQYPSSNFISNYGPQTLIAHHVVCGDAYVISGQSNASTTDLSQNEVDLLNTNYGIGSPYGKYSRTNGNLWWSEIWGVSAVNIATSVNHVGAWGLAIQHMIQKTYGIPTCVINGAYGGTSLQQHLPSTPNNFCCWTWNPLSSLFPFLNTRIYNAGLENDIKGIFWLQGDGNGNLADSISYTTQFTPLYNLWTTNFPDFKRFYEIQIPSATYPEHEMNVRVCSEDQRNMSLVFPRTTVMSANGIGFHRTEPGGHSLHHQAPGYIELARRLFLLLEKDVYGKTIDTIDITPPNIQKAYMTSAGHVSLYFDQEINLPTNWINLNNILSVIKFNTGYLSKKNANLQGSKLEFDIDPDTAIKFISYAGFISPSISTDMDYPCYIVNSKNIGALSFHNVKLNAYENGPVITSISNIEADQFNHAFSISPNPFTDRLYLETKTNSSIISVKVMDANGKLIFEKREKIESSLDLSFLNAGVYFIYLKNENGQSAKYKIIKLNH